MNVNKTRNHETLKEVRDRIDKNIALMEYDLTVLKQIVEKLLYITQTYKIKINKSN